MNCMTRSLLVCAGLACAGLACPGCGQVALLRQPERDIDDHVFLAADVTELADALEYLVRGHSVTLGRVLGMQEEAAVHPGPALHDRGPVHLRPARQERPDYLLRRRQHAADVDAGMHAEVVEGRCEHLRGGVARAGTQRTQRAVDLPG